MNTFLFYLLTVIGYVVVGLAWGFIRWKRYVDGEIEFYKSEKQRFLIFHRIRRGLEIDTVIPEFLVYEWRNYVKSTPRLKAVPPKASDFRGEISFDVLLWPVAMLLAGTITTYRIVMQRILAEYNKNTNKEIDKIRKDLER